jgi:serine/threonine protein kinase
VIIIVYVYLHFSDLVIGLSVASGPALFLLVLGVWFPLRKFKQRRIKVQKQKYFKQNRGQLLQQLLSQKADIAERMIIPLDELVKATNNFDRAREVGGGGHGTVYKGILSDQHVVAIKKSKISKQKEIDEFINEVAILSQINHKNVVKLFGCCLETEVPLLVYEFIPNGTLYHHLHIDRQKSSLSWSNRLRIATEIATSLAYLHSSASIPIIHRDIKSSNILLDDAMTSKISDFGASRYIPIDKTGSLTTRIQGTLGYMDPECFYTGRFTEKSDVYSFGVILVELLTRKKPTCSDLSNECGGLVPHFVNLHSSRNLIQIMDPQVIEEGGEEVQQVAMLAASCINMRGEERPTMRHVELRLEGLQQGSNKKYKKGNIVMKDFENSSNGANYSSGISEGHSYEESSRRYSLEQEMMMSARYPR